MFHTPAHKKPARFFVAHAIRVMPGVPIPRVGRNGTHCPNCQGTGADPIKTAEARKSENDYFLRARCWTCNGNGLDPAALFRWS